MATFNKPIITTQGLAMLKSELSGSAPLSFTKVIFTSDDYSQLSDTDVANLTDVKAKDITAKAQTFVGTDGTTKVRATADNRSSNQAFYIKGYALYAKQNGNEVLFAVAVSDTSDYVPVFNNKQLSQVSYTFQFAISETDNITLSDVHDIPVTQADIQSLTTYVNSKSSDLTNLINNATNKSAQDTLSKANQYTDSQVADKATKTDVDNATKSANSYADNGLSQANSAISDLSSKVDTKANNTDLTSAVNNINNNISKKADQTEVDSLQNGNAYDHHAFTGSLDDLISLPDGNYHIEGSNLLDDNRIHYGVCSKLHSDDNTVVNFYDGVNICTNLHDANGWRGWHKLGGVERLSLPQVQPKDFPVGRFITNNNPDIWDIPTTSWLCEVNVEYLEESNVKGGPFTISGNIKKIKVVSDQGEMFIRIISSNKDTGWKQII